MIECTLCSRSFEFNYLYERHINNKKTCNKNAPISFQCDYCDKLYATRSGLFKHKNKCPKKKDSEKSQIEMLIQMMEKSEKRWNNLANRLIDKDTSTINNNIGTVNNTTTIVNPIREVYFHVYPVGSLCDETIVKICVFNQINSKKIRVLLGKGDYILTIQHIFKAIHMNKNRKDLQNITYDNGKFMCMVDGRGWVNKSWESICGLIELEFDIALRRNYDQMDYKTKKCERAQRALNAFFELKLHEIVELKNLAKKLSIKYNPNNHMIAGMYSTESSQDDGSGSDISD